MKLITTLLVPLCFASPVLDFLDGEASLKLASSASASTVSWFVPVMDSEF